MKGQIGKPGLTLLAALLLASQVAEAGEASWSEPPGAANLKGQRKRDYLAGYTAGQWRGYAEGTSDSATSPKLETECERKRREAEDMVDLEIKDARRYKDCLHAVSAASIYGEAGMREALARCGY